MSTLLVLGNGFDLNAGYKTRYDDFFSSRRLSLKSSIDLIENLLSNLNNLTTHKASYILNIYFSNIEVKKLLLWDWYFLFRYINIKTDNINWCDVESNIHEFVSNKVNNDKIDTINVYKIFNHIKGITINSAQQLLFEFNDDSVGDFNRLFALILKRCYSTKIRENDIETSILELFLDDLKEFESEFMSYIELQKNDLYQEKSNTLFKQLGCLDSDFYILNFNYTNPTYGLTNELKKKYKFSDNIHGSIKDGNIIFGVDQSLLDNKNYNFMFSKTARKIYSKNNQRISDLSVINKSISKIVIYGHSLNDADFSYFISMFDYFNIYNSDITLEYYFTIYKEEEKNRIIKECNSRIINLIYKYSNHKNSDTSLLHKLVLEKRLLVKIL